MLRHFSVFHKILAVVCVVALGALASLAVSVASFQALNDRMQTVMAGGQVALVAARMNTNVQAMNAIQAMAAADPSPDSVAGAEKALKAEQVLFRQRFTAAKGMTADSAAGPMFDRIDAREQAFEHTASDVLAAARGGASPLAQSRAAATDAAALREAVRAFFRLEERSLESQSAEATALARSRTWLLVLASLGLLVAGAALSYTIAAMGISRPLRASVADVYSLAQGDLQVAIQGTQRRDELGEIAAALVVLRDRLRTARELEAATARDNEAKIRRAGVLHDLMAGFDRSAQASLEEVSSASAQLDQMSSALEHDADDIGARATTVSAAAAQAAANVETVAAAAEELAASITEISRQAAQSIDTSTQAVQAADRATTAVRSLSVATRDISTVVGLINDIAGQTNLLALNATIEAARAGETGKGFAVVAGEVKSLATQTAKATEDISRQIEAVQAQTADVVAALAEVITAIHRVEGVANGIAGAVEEQDAATREIASNVQQAAAGTGEVSRNIEGVLEAAGRNGAGASQVRRSSRQLTQVAEALRRAVEGFLSSVKAA